MSPHRNKSSRRRFYFRSLWTCRRSLLEIRKMKLKSRQIFIFVALIYFATALFNIGFVAVDDYHHGITYFIPAQKSSVANVVAGADFRSPIPNIALLGVSKTALSLGLTEPASQLRFINFVLCFLALAGIWSLSRIFKKES